MFFGGQTVTLGNLILAIGKVSTVVFTGLSDQESNELLIRSPPPKNPVATTRIQKSLAYFRVLEIFA